MIKGDASPEEVNEVLEFVKQNNGISYANEKMSKYRDDAIRQLESFPENDMKLSLAALVNFTIERES